MTLVAQMTDTLVVNPMAAIEQLEDEPGFISGGPVPGVGMRFLRISPAENPRLHTLFTELNQIGLAHLDIKNDLSDAEVGLLRDHGILIEPEDAPERPLFSCMLDDVPVDSKSELGSIVSPTFKFEPFDLARFRTLINDRHLSPHNATAWVTDARTGASWGYWLKPEQAEIVERLLPGLPVGEIDRGFAAKLTAAGILVNPEPADDTSIADAAAYFAENRYAVIADVVPPAQLKALQIYYAAYSAQGFMRLGDANVPLRFVRHNEAVARMVHFGLTPLMSKLAGIELEPTYSYSAVYIEGAELEPHIDREDCEFSFSMQLDYSPESDSGLSPWALYLSTAAEKRLTDLKKDLAVHLGNGSCLAYKGRELFHYRMPLAKGHRSTSLFFHYVPR